LLSDTKARSANYSVVINVWIGADGRVSKAELASSSGISDVDRSIREALTKLHFSVAKAPPQNMPQPLKIKVTSKI
jgi:TonB family protein